MSNLAFRANIQKLGGPEVIEWLEEPIPTPAQGEVTVRHDTIGVNYTDIYHRTGEYPVPVPTGLGVEAAGVIEAVGPGVSSFKVGDRVVYGGRPLGSYSTARTMPIERMVGIPDDISSEKAASLLFKGLAVEYLIRQCYPVKPDETVLFHAAAGGIGQIATQWLSHIGAKVIGTVSSKEKADIALSNGCAHAINYKTESFPERVKEITGGRGVDVGYDAIGRDTVEQSFECLRPRGMLVNYGNTSGAPAPLDFKILQRNSLYVTRPSIANYASTLTQIEKASVVVFDMIRKGVIRSDNPIRYPLKDAAKAHTDLEARRTTGSVILVP